MPPEQAAVDDLPTPTPRELEILKVLWEHGPLAVADVHRLLPPVDGRRVALTTVQTLIRLMENPKGLVRHTAEGRAFVYSAVYSREDSAARFLDRVFDGAASELVHTLLKAEKIPADELEQLRRLIDQARKKS